MIHRAWLSCRAFALFDPRVLSSRRQIPFFEVHARTRAIFLREAKRAYLIGYNARRSGWIFNCSDDSKGTK